MMRAQAGGEAARFVLDDMIEDVEDRLAFLRFVPTRALIIGDHGGGLARALGGMGTVVVRADPAHGLDDEAPLPGGPYEFIAALGTLDTVNDLPGALIHCQRALASGGLLIATLMGAGSLPRLREAMLVADGDRAHARIHPAVDVRAGAQLLQRTGFANPVADTRGIDVGYRGLDRLVEDLRAQGLGAAWADPPPPLSRQQCAMARAAFLGGEPRTVEHFEILTLSGWRA